MSPIQLQLMPKGTTYLKVLDSINKVTNYMQVESTMNMIELFAKKTGDMELKSELTSLLLEKAKDYQCE